MEDPNEREFLRTRNFNNCFYNSRCDHHKDDEPFEEEEEKEDTVYEEKKKTVIPEWDQTFLKVR